MKLGIMQPYFAPYLGYISLIKHTDKFILFDPVQFIRHGWIERNRILTNDGGSCYISIPLEKHSRNTIIQDIKIKNSVAWKDKLRSQLTFYKKGNRYYRNVMSCINAVLDNNYDSITHLNRDLLIAICDYLSIDASFEIFSEMNLKIETPHGPDEWALNICKAHGGVKEYWNPPGGMSFFNPEKYKAANLKLIFQKVKLIPYKQRENNFQPGLSIIDVMMFNHPEKINEMLDNYELLV